MNPRIANLVEVVPGEKYIVNYYQPVGAKAILEVGKLAEFRPEGEESGRLCKIDRFIPATDSVPMLVEVTIRGVPFETIQVSPMDLFTP